MNEDASDALRKKNIDDLAKYTDNDKNVEALVKHLETDDVTDLANRTLSPEATSNDCSSLEIIIEFCSVMIVHRLSNSFAESFLISSI